MNYVATKTQREALIGTLHLKMTAQTFFAFKKICLAMRRASKNPPKGSIIIGTFRKATPKEGIRDALRAAVGSNEALTFKGDR